MAILKRIRLALPVFALMMGAWAIGEWYGREQVTFSHALHVEDQGLSCSMCHPGIEDDTMDLQPKASTCAECHAAYNDYLSEEKLKKAYGNIGEDFNPPMFSDQPEFTSTANQSEEIKFSHEVHVGSEISCSRCHGDVGQGEDLSMAKKLTMDNCMSCHTEKKVSKDCSTCHMKVDRDYKPKSHDRAWNQLHGREMKMSESTMGDCSLCHEESSCQSCHSTTKPRSHNNHFRIRGHGVLARMDRESCAECHMPDACDRCHAQSAPRTHTASWGAPVYRHCTGCHISQASSTEGCGLCHAAATHSSADALPTNSTHQNATGIDCYNCHVPSDVNHTVTGDNCLECHK